MRPPTLLLVSSFAPPQTGGIERFLERLTAAYSARGGVVTAVLPPGSQLPGATVWPGDLFPWKRMRPSYLPLLWRLPNWKRRARADTVVFGHASNAVLIGAILSLVLRFPYAVIVHGMDIRRLPRWMAWFVLGRAEAIFANSRSTMQYVTDLIEADSRTVLLTPAVEVPASPSSRSEPWHGLTVARLVPRKGIARLIEALDLAQAKNPKLRLTIVGDGPERAHLEALVNEKKLTQSVTLTGRISDVERSALQDRCGWFALVPEPTRDSSDVEGFGIALLEAQAAGLPVITANAGGVLDAAAEQGSIRVPPGDTRAIAQAMLALARNDDDAHRKASAARAWAMSLGSWEDRARIIASALALRDEGSIAVVVPAFNSEKTILRTLTSIKAQQGVQTEVIVVDDGSTDQTAAVAERAGARVLRQNNSGAPAARNAGAKATKSPYLFFCDADVELRSDALAQLLRALATHPDAAYAYASFRYGFRTHRCGPFDPERLKSMNYISTMSLIRREAFPGFDPSLLRLQDWDLWLTMLEHGHRGIWVSQHLFSASVRGSGISGRLGGPPPASAVATIRAKHGLR